MSLPSKELSESGLDALIAQERTRVMAPLTEWRTLSAQLRDEGLIRAQSETAGWRSTVGSTAGASSDALVPPVRHRGVMRFGRRLVASAALLGIGILVGRGMTFGHEGIQVLKTAMEQAADSVQPKIPQVTEEFESAEEARKSLAASQTQWHNAAAYLAAHDSTFTPTPSPETFRDRLLALDPVVNAAHAALQEAPGDPVLNQYYMSAYSARERAVQGLRNNLPAGVRLTGF